MLKLKDFFGGSYNSFLNICINFEKDEVEKFLLSNWNNLITENSNKVIMLQLRNNMLVQDLLRKRSLLDLYSYYIGCPSRTWYGELIKLITPFNAYYKTIDSFNDTELKNGLNKFIELSNNNADFNSCLVNLFKIDLSVTDVQLMDKIANNKVMMTWDETLIRITNEFDKIPKLPSLISEEIFKLKSEFAFNYEFMNALGDNLNHIFPYKLIDFMDSEYDYD